jgi:hypothetical protein
MSLQDEGHGRGIDLERFRLAVEASPAAVISAGGSIDPRAHLPSAALTPQCAGSGQPHAQRHRGDERL